MSRRRLEAVSSGGGPEIHTLGPTMEDSSHMNIYSYVRMFIYPMPDICGLLANRLPEPVAVSHSLVISTS